MMTQGRIFCLADSHFSHSNILKVRPQYSTVEAMNRDLVERWNATVTKRDTVYHLGDVSMWRRENGAIVRELNGTKHLIRGNHDNFGEDVYKSHGFSKVLHMKELSGLVMTHVPIHPSQLVRWPLNIHGHIHQERVMQYLDYCWDYACGAPPDPPIVDSRYICISVEQTDYKPRLLDDIRQQFAQGSK